MNAYVAITIDDGWDSDYYKAYREMSKRGMKGTSYIVTGDVGKAGKLTWPQIKTMLNGGWAVECHTHNHPHLPRLSKAEIHAEMKNVNGAFTEQGLAVPRHHAYPFGARNTTADEVIRLYRDTVRGVSGKHVKPNCWRLPGTVINLHTEKDLNAVKGYIDKTIANKASSVLLFHQIVDTAPSKYASLASLFVRMLDYIKTKRIRVVTIPQLYRRVSTWI